MAIDTLRPVEQIWHDLQVSTAFYIDAQTKYRQWRQYMQDTHALMNTFYAAPSPQAPWEVLHEAAVLASDNAVRWLNEMKRYDARTAQLQAELIASEKASL